MFQIEKNIPLPADPRGRPAKYPFQAMSVGDSFAVPFSTGIKTINQIYGSITWAKRKNPERNFIARTDKDAEVVRVWRVA